MNPQTQRKILETIDARRALTKEGARQGGFTLMELLIAMTLVGLMLVLLFSGLRLGARSWDAAELRATESGDQRLIWTFLQRSLKEMKAVYLPGEQSDEHVAFSGGRDALEFVGTMSERLGPGGAYLLRIEAPEAGKSRNLVLRRWLYHPEVLEGLEAVPEWKPLYERVGEARPLSDDDDRWNRALYGEHILIEGIEALEIEYYGTTEGSADPDWHDEWSEAAAMPTLVRLRVYRDQGDWPPLLAALPDLSDGTGSGNTGGQTSVDRRGRRGRRGR